jgi:hypothetical protein
MAYSEQTWTALPASVTASLAEKLQHIENGLDVAADVADAGGGSGNVTGSVNGVTTAMTLWTGTQAMFDAIVSKDANAWYGIHA